VAFLGYPPSVKGIEFRRLGRQDRSKVVNPEWGLGRTEACIWRRENFRWKMHGWRVIERPYKKKTHRETHSERDAMTK
jgi:hypothetical protein